MNGFAGLSYSCKLAVNMMKFDKIITSIFVSSLLWRAVWREAWGPLKFETRTLRFLMHSSFLFLIGRDGAMMGWEYIHHKI